MDINSFQNQRQNSADGRNQQGGNNYYRSAPTPPQDDTTIVTVTKTTAITKTTTATPTLRVMRLYKPELFSSTTTPSANSSLTSALTLPSSFGIIHVGETFTAYLGFLNTAACTTNTVITTTTDTKFPTQPGGFNQNTGQQYPSIQPPSTSTTTQTTTTSTTPTSLSEGKNASNDITNIAVNVRLQCPTSKIDLVGNTLAGTEDSGTPGK